MAIGEGENANTVLQVFEKQLLGSGIMKLLKCEVVPAVGSWALIVCVLICMLSPAGAATVEAWVRRFNSAVGSSDYANKIIVDNQNNVIYGQRQQWI
jgi:hypothetical protein